MPVNRDAPTEFGGKEQQNTVQPARRPDGKPGHEATAAERVRLQHITQQPVDGTFNQAAPLDREKAAEQGLLPRKEQERLRREAGDLDRGVE